MHKTFQQTIIFALLCLLGLAVAGLFLTSGWMNPSQPASRSGWAHAAAAARVDDSALVTAQSAAALATSPGERYFASEALRLGDQEVDLAFASALRNAAANPAPLTPETRQLNARVKEAQARVNENQAEADRLAKLAAAAKEPNKGELEQQLQLVHAQLMLDQDELADAQRDLMRAGGDAQSIIQRLLDQHEKSQDHVQTDPSQAASAAAAQAASRRAATPGSLVAQLGEWRNSRAQWMLLRKAQQDTDARQSALVQSHDLRERKMQAAKSASPTAAANRSGVAGESEGEQNTTTALTSVRQVSQEQQEMADLDKRIETEREMGDVYGRWSALVRSRERSSLHGVIQSAFWIVLILLLTLIADYYIHRFSTYIAPERNRLLTIRSVLHFVTRTVGFIAILFVIFGRPSQLATILGLASAGLAVALKDFIVGFFGWFMLMGRNGMRRGDWVEINGVQGKVIEVGLLHTVLLETGNWTDAGHPTGRKVTFVNSFPVEGHYFNFTTAGQWLWDELQVGLRSGTNPYPIVEEIQKIVAKETESNARLAEQEWKKATATSALHALSAASSISVRPTDSGVTVVVRYIARADEREETRSRLYGAICELLIEKNAGQPAVAAREQQPQAAALD